MACNECNTTCDSNCNCVVRYTGPNIDCLGISTGDSFETVMATLSNFVCDINFEDGVGISNIEYDSGSDILTVTMTDGSTYDLTGLKGADGVDGADGADANSEYGNTLFVDAVYGDDLTGTRERFDLPYLTIAGALAGALVDDNIIVRAGAYGEDVILKNRINIYFEENTFLGGRITDNEVSITSKVSGYLNINESNNAILIQGPNSNIKIECDTINGADSPITTRPAAGVDGSMCTVYIKCRRITGISSNYGVTVQRILTLTVLVTESIETLATTSGTVGLALFTFGDNFEGSVHIKTPRVYIGDCDFDDSGILFHEDEFVNASNILIEIDRVDIDYDYSAAALTPKGIINKGGDSNSIIKINTLKSIVRPIVAVSGVTTGTLLIEGNYYSDTTLGIHYSSNQKVVAKNSVFKRGEGGDNRAEVVLIGDIPTSYINLSGPLTGHQIEILGCKIIKQSFADGAVNAVGVIINKTVDSTPYIVRSYIDFTGVGTPKAIGRNTDVTGENDFYVFKTVGNVDNTGAFFTNNSTSTEGYHYDINFLTFEDLD